MFMESLSLARQIDIVFRQLSEELSTLSSGTVFIQIRNNIVGKFGVRHLPIESRDGKIQKLPEQKGLTESHVLTCRQTAIDALKLKRNWTHGEILIDFSMKHNLLSTSISIESNYNLAAVIPQSRNNNSNSQLSNTF